MSFCCLYLLITFIYTINSLQLSCNNTITLPSTHTYTLDSSSISNNNFNNILFKPLSQISHSSIIIQIFNKKSNKTISNFINIQGYSFSIFETNIIYHISFITENINNTNILLQCSNIVTTKSPDIHFYLAQTNIKKKHLHLWIIISTLLLFIVAFSIFIYLKCYKMSDVVDKAINSVPKRKIPQTQKDFKKEYKLNGIKNNEANIEFAVSNTVSTPTDAKKHHEYCGSLTALALTCGPMSPPNELLIVSPSQKNIINDIPHISVIDFDQEYQE